MELQLIMDTGTENIWLNGSLSPTYQQLSPGRLNDCEPIVGQQTSLSRQGMVQSLLWKDNKDLSPKASPEHQHHNQYRHQQLQYPDSPLSTSSQSPEHKLTFGSSSLHSPPSSQALKRPADDSYQHQHSISEPERKLARSNSSQGWPSPVEELADNSVTDFDGSLSDLAASDFATAVASYNISEALLSLPSLTVFKQEALSPENQHNTTNLNHNPSQRSISGVPSSNGSADLAEPDSNNNAQNSANLHHQQLLSYSSSANDEYPLNSSSGNHVSSSQQSSDFNEDCRFQYILAAATSIATKVNEETLTYLNQGQSYEIKLKKLGDLSAFRGKTLESTIRICFHERRLQYTEREQILAWQRARPGERLLEVDVPLSYGMLDVCQSSSLNNSVDFTWDPTKEIGCYVKINCISTEFTPKKHGGEKGVPFRIQVETRLSGGPRLHAASCQVKVFKLKGADRKHKQDRDKIQRRPPHEQDKFQPSYDCTILTDIPVDSLSSSNSVSQNVGSPYSSTDVISPQSRVSGNSSPVTAPLALSSSLVPVASTPESSIKEDVGPSPALPSPATAIQPEQNSADIEHQQRLQVVESCQQSQGSELSADASAAQTSSWLRAQRFHAFESTFASFSASDILRLSRDDLIQICGLADGIRLYNALHAKMLQPKLSLYFALESSGPASLWRPVYLDSLTLGAFTNKLLGAIGLPRERLHSILMLGPQGIHVVVTNELVANIKDECMFLVETINEAGTDRYKLLLKPSPH
ncbi:transcription factor CP2-like protein 1 isoform X2 [Copidosoma floridanum]|uniref:transcription factor CP2-like protein 1 isoform X2 n=1 Tax=Copidosoma floridanum TaxID=29053 RepID=UPI0006C9D158|nr:transcription factor CP2-like protein 1 isoform X2 [Copidosoma floridanum]